MGSRVVVIQIRDVLSRKSGTKPGTEYWTSKIVYTNRVSSIGRVKMLILTEYRVKAE